MDYTKIYRTDMVQLLGSGEEILAIVPYRLAHGAERVARTPEVVERRLKPLPRGLRRRAAELGTRERRSGSRTLLDRILDIDWPWNRIDWDEKIGGAAVAGAPGSYAVRIADATRDRVGQFGVVTDRRLVVVQRVAKDRYEVVAEAPRADIVSVRRRGRPFQRGRVVIAFADDSSLAVDTGILLAGQARRFVATLSREHGGI